MTQSPILKAAAWMVASLFSFSLIAISGRELSTELNAFQIMFFRSVLGIIILSTVLHFRGWQQISTRYVKKHIYRNITHYIGQVGWLYGLAHISLTEVFAIEFTTPIWVAILATVFLHEKLTQARILAITLGIIGVLVILRPGFGIIHFASIAVLLSAISFAFTIIITKDLSHLDSTLCILFYMTGMQLLLSAPPTLYQWVTPSQTGWLWLIIISITALVAHYCVVKALSLADVMIVIPIDFLRLPLIAVVGYVFYNESLDMFVIMGAIIMIIGNFINIVADKQKTAPPTD